MPSSSPRSALYNGRLPRRRASEHGPWLVDERDDGSAVIASRGGLNAKIPCMSPGLDDPLYVPLERSQLGLCGWRELAGSGWDQ